MTLDRRSFLQGSLTAAVAGSMALRTGARAADGANEKIVVGVMGLGRGKQLIESFAAHPGVRVEYVCDVDSRRLGPAAALVKKLGGNDPQQVGDFRKILDDKQVDALVCAAPDHWHAPATILACKAGKHVYCEKPASHNPQEGEWMVEAARKYDRTVQLGTQRRSMPSYREGIARLHAGAIGKPLLARAYYFNPRPTIGRGKSTAVPEWLNYDLWQGPAPEREFRDNLVHYNWHWFWHWGTAELGNNGVHLIDVCRWGLNVEHPTRVTAAGGRYRYDDDQETPDTSVTTFDFGGQSICWEGRSFYRPIEAEQRDYEAAFYGEKGTLTIGRTNVTVYDEGGKIVEEEKFKAGDMPHIEDFVSAVRERRRPNADIEIGHRTTMLCHLGNIAWRTGKTLHLDAQTHKPTDSEALSFWGREYRSGWEPKV